MFPITQRVNDQARIPEISTTAPRILIATGDRALDQRIAKMVATLSYSAQFAGDNVEAMGLLLGASPPEIAMLGESGLEVAAEVKRRSRAKQTWILLLTRATDPKTVTLGAIAMAADAGVDDLLLCNWSRHESGIEREPVSETDLRIRLGVAARVLEMGQGLAHQLTNGGAGPHASRDALTGLWDRESLLALLFPETDRVQRMGTPLTLLLLDLDYFGRINDEYGTRVGDQILQELAARLRRDLRSYDLLGRSGDDEFLVALPGCNSEQSLQLASRIRLDMLHRPFAAGRDVITLTVSIGLAQSRGRSPLVALREAERALAAAKLDGRNCEREFLQSQERRAHTMTIQ